MPSGNPNGRPKPEYNDTPKELRRAAYHEKYVENHKEELRLKSAQYRKDNPIKVRYTHAMGSASQRGISFSLLFEEWLEIVSKPCTYALPGDSGQRIGIDRIDNSKGYEEGNCQPCCYKHNMVRLDVFTHAQMLDLVVRYAVHCGDKPKGRKHQ